MSTSTELLPPIVAEIAAPAATVYGLLSLDLPNAFVQPLPEPSPEGRVAQIELVGRQHWQSVEVIISQPPDVVTYRLIRGPCTFLERHFHVRDRNGHSRVLVEGHWASGGFFGKAGKQKQVVQATRLLLAGVQQQAERLARTGGLAQPAAVPVDLDAAPDSPRQLRERLLRAVDQQEVVEWGMAGHGVATARWAGLLCASLQLPDELRHSIEFAAAVHDVGKVKIEGHLFDRGGVLSASGQQRVEEHPRLGEELVLRLPDSEILAPALRHHHERWDGTGYPDRLAGAGIPLAARIIAVAESVDAIQRPLPDRRARSAVEVAAILERHAGRQWDPDLAHRMIGLLLKDEPSAHDQQSSVPAQQTH